MRERSRLFDSVVVSSWWVILFFLILIFLYDQATIKSKRETVHLCERREALLERRRVSSSHLEELNVRLQSEEDPRWIELLLREKLGLVGAHETKILFLDTQTS